MKTHTLQEYRPDFSPAYVANGLVGLRVGPIPLLNGTALVNGYVGMDAEERIESFQPAPYPIGGDILVGGVWLSRRPDLAIFKEQSYDFSCGELRSRFDFKVNAVTARVEVLTFCSRTQPALAIQQVSFTVDQPCDLTLRAIMNPEGLPGKCLRREAPNPGWDVVDACLHWECRGGIGSCGAAFWTRFLGDDQARDKRNHWGHENALFKDYAVSAQPGKTYLLQQIGALVPSVMQVQPDQQAIRLVGIGKHWGFDQLREDNRQAWAELWKGRVRLLGADAKWQDIADAGFFYLHCSAHRSNPCSVACFGVGYWRRYWGNIFWDAETYMFPPLLLTAPQSARAMLDYRTRLLPAARNNAALHGYRGAQFPWQSSNHGGENMPSWAVGIFSEQHISLDVAFAFAQYVHATGDEQFLRQQAWPVLEGVADWIASRFRKTARGYEVSHIVGVDEGIYDIDNNSHFNMAATVVLREAQGFARRLGIAPPPEWGEIERHIFIPLDPQTRVILKHDRYEYKGGECMPETLLAFFPLGYRTAPEVERATFQYYLDLAHTAMHLPFVPALIGAFAARMGNRKFAAELFSAGIGNFITEPFHTFIEVSDTQPGVKPPALTPFVTGPGSFLMTCLYGLTGLQLGPGEPESWFKFPVAMPELWDGIEVERIWARGRPARLLAHHGEAKGRIEYHPGS